MDRPAVPPTRRTQVAQAGRTTPRPPRRLAAVGPAAAAILAVGLPFAVVTDGRLPAPWGTLLFALLLLDLVAVEWLTRP